MKWSANAVPGGARAERLSELNRAIDEAQCLAWRIGVVEGRSAHALELYVQLELIRAEAETLRGAASHGERSAFHANFLNAFGNFASAGEGLEE